VLIGGRDLSRLSDAARTELRKKMVGFVFQKYNLLPTLSAADNIAIARYIAGTGTVPDPKFEEMLELLGIGQRMNHKPRALSGGEQQRVAIARAIVNHPAILLADEPPATWTRRIPRRCWAYCAISTSGWADGAHDHARSQRGAYGHRIVHMLDGEIVETTRPSQNRG